MEEKKPWTVPDGLVERTLLLEAAKLKPKSFLHKSRWSRSVKFDGKKKIDLSNEIWSCHCEGSLKARVDGTLKIQKTMALFLTKKKTYQLTFRSLNDKLIR